MLGFEHGSNCQNSVAALSASHHAVWREVYADIPDIIFPRHLPPADRARSMNRYYVVGIQDVPRIQDVRRIRTRVPPRIPEFCPFKRYPDGRLLSFLFLSLLEFSQRLARLWGLTHRARTIEDSPLMHRETLHSGCDPAIQGASG